MCWHAIYFPENSERKKKTVQRRWEKCKGEGNVLLLRGLYLPVLPLSIQIGDSSIVKPRTSCYSGKIKDKQAEKRKNKVMNHLHFPLLPPAVSKGRGRFLPCWTAQAHASEYLEARHTEMAPALVGRYISVGCFLWLFCTIEIEIKRVNKSE